MDRDKPNLRRISRAEMALGRTLLKVSRKAVQLTASAEKRLSDPRALADRLWQKQLKPRATLIGRELGKYAEFLRESFSPIYDELHKKILPRLEASKVYAVSKHVPKHLRSRIRKVSHRERELIVQGMVVSFLILPMITIPYFAKLGVGNSNGKSLIDRRALAKADTARRRYALAPSRGTAQAQEATRAPSAVATQTPAVATTTPPPQDPNLPPELTQNTQNLDPRLLTRFDAFRTFIFQQFHVVIEIRSGWRSTAEQAQLYATLPAGYANPPGTSQHERGEAIDYTNYSPQFDQYLGQFGLKAPYAPKEYWHVEIVEPH